MKRYTTKSIHPPHYDITYLLVDKLDAVRAQLESALLLYFTTKDDISTHTLAAAAYNVLRDYLKHHKGQAVFIKGSSQTEPRVQKLTKNWIKEVNIPENFFKHADKDSAGHLLHKTLLTEMLLFECIMLYMKEQPLTLNMRVFHIWFQICYPEFFKEHADDRFFELLNDLHKDKPNRLQFFRAGRRSVKKAMNSKLKHG